MPKTYWRTDEVFRYNTEPASTYFQTTRCFHSLRLCKSHLEYVHTAVHTACSVKLYLISFEL